MQICESRFVNVWEVDVFICSVVLCGGNTDIAYPAHSYRKSKGVHCRCHQHHSIWNVALPLLLFIFQQVTVRWVLVYESFWTNAMGLYLLPKSQKPSR